MLIMSLRSHLDRYCSKKAVARDPISSSTRSRSPTRTTTSSQGSSPFHPPPGWNPPSQTTHRPVIVHLDLKPMQRLADTNPYFNILAPKVAGNLSTTTYDSLFQTFKVIYPDYAGSYFVADLKTLVTDTFLQRWSIHLQPKDFYMTIDTDQGAQMIDDLPHSILDILNWFYPTWKTHQNIWMLLHRVQTHLSAWHLLRTHETLVSDSRNTGLAVQLQVIPRSHPFFSSSSSNHL